MFNSEKYVHSNIRICITFTYSYMYIPPRPDKLNTCSNTPQYTHSVSWMLALTKYPKNTYSISWILNIEADFKAAWVGQKAALPWVIELNPSFTGQFLGVYVHIPIVEYVYFGLSYSHIRIKEYDIYVAKWSKSVAYGALQEFRFAVFISCGAMLRGAPLARRYLKIGTRPNERPCFSHVQDWSPSWWAFDCLETIHNGKPTSNLTN